MYPSRQRKPLSKALAGKLTVDPSLERYMADLLDHGPGRLKAVRQSSYARDFLKNLEDDQVSWEVDSPWSCSKIKSPERDHTERKVEANKDTTVGTKKDVNALRHYRSKLTDIWTAAFNNELEEVNLYIDCGADVNAKNSLNGNGETPLHDAALGGHLEMIELLVQQGGADINSLDEVGNTPLHMAARAGHYDAAMRLLDFNAESLVKNEACHTPWLVADMKGHVKLRDQLPKPKNYSVRTAGRAADATAKIRDGGKPADAAHNNKYHMAQSVQPAKKTKTKRRSR